MNFPWNKESRRTVGTTSIRTQKYIDLGTESLNCKEQDSVPPWEQIQCSNTQRMTACGLAGWYNQGGFALSSVSSWPSDPLLPPTPKPIRWRIVRETFQECLTHYSLPTDPLPPTPFALIHANLPPACVRACLTAAARACYYQSSH